MGTTLSAPVEPVRVRRFGGPAFRCAVAELQGWRSRHETAHALTAAGATGAGAACAGTEGAEGEEGEEGRREGCERAEEAAAEEAAACGCWLLAGHGPQGPEVAEAAAAALAGAVGPGSGPSAALPQDERIRDAFAATDARLRAASAPEGDNAEVAGGSGATACGALVALGADGRYVVKLVSCGDVQGILVRSPREDAAAASPVSVIVAGGGGEAAPVESSWPLVVATEPHCPGRPAERARIETAGGRVSQEGPPRIDGKLAVSRTLGDFDFKEQGRPPCTQKVTCEPDIYKASGVEPGSVCVLANKAVWDAMPAEAVAGALRDWLAREPGADLGDLAARLLRACLRLGSRASLGMAVVQLSAGVGWASAPDEIQNFQGLLGQGEVQEEVRKQQVAFLRRAGFAAEPCPCDVCGRWVQRMSQCGCRRAVYCCRGCQRTAWKEHKATCSAARPCRTSPGDPATAAPGACADADAGA